ncbi:MAG: lysine--tRNA ligase [Candidatus Helarchaeota archaeon]
MYRDTKYYKDRIKQIEEMKSLNMNPFKEKYDKKNNISECRSLELGTIVQTAGRIKFIRRMGKVSFVDLEDFSGRIQLFFNKNVLLEKYDLLKKYTNVGDFIGVKGEMMKTKAGEISILVKDFELLSKCILQLPNKWKGVVDQEICYRKRYLDLLMNEESMERFKKRINIVKFFRNYLDERGFWEVETPILQTKASGALARPFVTHHNSLHMDVYLRIAPETYLKRLMVGRFEKVYEIARCFRNEDYDREHLQDFTMLEFYVAWWNYEDNMKFVQEMLQALLKKINGTLIVKYEDKKIDFGGKWPRYSFRELIKKDAGIDINKFKTVNELIGEIKRVGINLDLEQNAGFGTVIDKLYKKVSRPKLIQPTFLMAHPIDISPLARPNDENPAVVDRFQVVANTWEIVNAYSELIDPIKQREAFEIQQKAHEAGDEEALELDEKYLEAMSYGMPPMSGVGIGIDRLATLILNCQSIRDVVFFPLMHEETKDKYYDNEK